MLPALSAPPQSRDVTAECAALDALLADRGRTMLARASRDEEIIRTAEATIKVLDAQARPDPQCYIGRGLCGACERYHELLMKSVRIRLNTSRCMLSWAE